MGVNTYSDLCKSACKHGHGHVDKFILHERVIFSCWGHFTLLVWQVCIKPCVCSVHVHAPFSWPYVVHACEKQTWINSFCTNAEHVVTNCTNAEHVVHERLNAEHLCTNAERVVHERWTCFARMLNMLSQACACMLFLVPLCSARLWRTDVDWFILHERWTRYHKIAQASLNPYVVHVCRVG
jgi:hypothetical protein